MDIHPLRILPAAGVAVFVLVCAVFFAHQLRAGLHPDTMESGLEDQRWLIWTAAGIVAPSALAIRVLGPRIRR